MKKEYTTPQPCVTMHKPTTQHGVEKMKNTTGGSAPHDEPYETMPEGEPHAVADWITRIVAGLLLALIVLIASACPAQAEDRNWCADWQDGYEASFYLVCRQCQAIEPKECPEPEPTDSSGYMRGVKDGAADGKQKQKEWI